MSAWGTPGLRDDVTCFLLERDGWRDESDRLAPCAWCGLEFWQRRVRDGVPGRYCSRRCWLRKLQWFRQARLGGRAGVNRYVLAGYHRRRAAKKGAA